MDRALRYDGLLPNVLGEDGKVRMASPTPEDVRDMRAYIQENRAEATPFDIVVEGQTPGEDPERAIETVRPYAEAGATWWIEAMWEAGSLDEVLERIRQGPPNL
jgi:hypothetical protein